MISRRTGSVLIFNGQLYNFRELRRQLPDFPCQGHGDTEVLLAALDRWGLDAVSHLDGMYAFAWWNPRERNLILARDRLGIKPLYFNIAQGRLCFASEVRALRTLGMGGGISHDGLASFITYGSVYEPHTLFEGITPLSPGTVAVWNGSRLERTRYWVPSAFVNQQQPSRPGQLVRELVSRAVTSHLVSDAKLGVFLSSGMDSSILAAEATKSHAETEGLTLAFGTGSQDESPAAAEFARAIGMRHRAIPEDLDEVQDVFEDFIAAQDQPSIDGLNTWLISRAAKRAGFKVMMSGLGADELFFGYSSFQRIHLWSLTPPALRQPLLKLWARGSRDKARASEIGTDASDLFRWMRALWPPSYLSRIGFLPSRACTADPVALLSGAEAENRLSHFELTHYLRSTLLRDSDSMSMAHGLELRVPFLDKALVETCLSLSAACKWTKTPKPKGLLKAAFPEVLQQIPQGPKRGFQLPFATWLKGPLKAFSTDALESEDGHLPPFHRHSVSQGLQNGATADWSRLLQLVIWRCWKRRHSGQLIGTAA